MHKSKLAGFIIDCETSDLNAASEFWSKALGMECVSLPDEEGEKYVRLLDRHEELHIEVQKVDHPSRVHLDIETDDIEAEVKRLESLGAKRLGDVRSWCVMEAPTGQKFCVVRKVSPGFDSKANLWR
jgi:catechol 2,3-dioxygenase-like lactoylglutathione lyase family enzyme